MSWLNHGTMSADADEVGSCLLDDGSPLADVVRPDVLDLWVDTPALASMAVASSALPADRWLAAVHAFAGTRQGSEWVRCSAAPRVEDPDLLALLLDDVSLGFRFVSCLVEASPLGGFCADPRTVREVAARVKSREGLERMARLLDPTSVATTPVLAEVGLACRMSVVLPAMVAVPESVVSTGALEFALRHPVKSMNNLSRSADTAYALPHPSRWALMQDADVDRLLEFRPDVIERLAQDDEWLPAIARTSHWRDEYVSRGLGMVRKHLKSSNVLRSKFKAWHPAAFLGAMIVHHGTSPASRDRLMPVWENSGVRGRSVTITDDFRRSLDAAYADPGSASALSVVRELHRVRVAGLRLRHLDDLAQVQDSRECELLAAKNVHRHTQYLPERNRQFDAGKEWSSVGFACLEFGDPLKHRPSRPINHVDDDDVQALEDMRVQVQGVKVSDAEFAWRALLDLRLDAGPGAKLSDLVATALAVAGID